MRQPSTKAEAPRAALTPAAVLMFRYNNPDVLLTFLFVAAAWAVQRAVVDGRTRWLVAAGVHPSPSRFRSPGTIPPRPTVQGQIRP